MPKKTQPEIDAEIKALELCKTYAPHRTMFGKDNHAAIDEQIGALANGIDDDDAYDKWGDEGREDFNQDTLDSVLEVIRWRDGDSDEAPSTGWDSYKPTKTKAPSKRPR